jgi:hypothetical protein
MKAKLLAGSGLILLLASVLWVALTPGAPAVRVHFMEADYPVYAGVRDIAAHSTIVVRGTATELLPARRVLPPGIRLDEMPAEKAAGAGFLVTDIVFRVEQILRGAPDIAGATIIVSHLGGSDGANQYVMEAEPLSEVGQEYLLFLERTPEGNYVVVGGGQGRYLVQDGRLRALTTEAEALPLVASLRDVALPNLAEQLK